MLEFKKQNCILQIVKDGDTVYGELLVDEKSLRRDSEGFKIFLGPHENERLSCVLDGKNLYYNNDLIKTYDSVFAKNTILDLYIDNQIGEVKLGNIVLDKIETNLNLKHYKVNVTTDDEYTIVRYANLHQHTQNSLLDGIVKIPELADKSEYACAITDHGNMFGWYDMKKAFDKAGKKAIIGEEFYLETLGGPRLILEDSDNTDELMFGNVKAQNPDGLNGEHLIVLAKNNQGIKNLFKLSSEASNHFHRKPHITFELLDKYKDGLIICSACIAGGLNKFIGEYLKVKDKVKDWIEDYGDSFYESEEYKETDHNHYEEIYEYNHRKSREYIDWFYDRFKDDFYLEYQDHHFPLEKRIMDEMVKIRDTEYPQIKIVATCDAHYLNKEDSYVHELWLCNQTKKTINDPKRMQFSGDGYYVHTSEEMLELFPTEYLDATLEVADKVNYEKEKSGYHLPHFPLPKGFKNEEEYLRHMCRKGFTEKFKGTPAYKDPVYLNRMKSEIDTVVSMGWPAYFLIVSDFIKWAEDDDVRSHWQDYFPNRTLEEIPNELLDKQKIYVGAARGSGAGCLMNYCLGITKVEPITYDLKFERFLNPDRISMPK